MNRSINRRLTSTLALCLATTTAGAGGSAVPAMVLAQGTDAAPATQTAVQVTVDISSQPMSDALNAFARQTGLQVVIDWNDSTGITAPTVQGKMTTDEALSKLLENSGLEYRFINARTVAVRTKARATADLPTAPLRLAQSLSTADAYVAEGSSSSSAAGQQAELIEVMVYAKYVPETNNSATKMDISLLETPQSVSVITRDQIELLNSQTIEQAVRYTSGIVSGRYGDDSRSDWLTLRGFKPATYLDGLQLPEGSFAFSRMDLSALESIEILKGPSSGLYGAAPPGGLINLTSRRPSRDFRAQFGVQAGTFDHFQGSGEVSGPLNDERTLLARLGSLYQDSGSVVEHAVPSQRLMVQPSLTWQPNDRLSVTLLSHFQDDDMGIDGQFLPEIGTALPNPNGELPRSTYVSDRNFDLFKRDEYHVGYVLDFKINEALEFHQAVRKSSIDVEQKMLYGGGYFEDAEQRMLARNVLLWIENQNNLATDSALQFDFDTGPLVHKLLAGVDYRKSNGSYQFGFDAGPAIDVYNPVYGVTIPDPPLYSSPTQDETQIGFYLQDHAKIGNWVVTGTLRRDQYDSKTLERLDGSRERFDQQATTGRAGVNYVFDSGFSPYVSYSKSFQPQSGFDGVTGNPFAPTTGAQYEMGMKYQPRSSSGLVSLIAYDLKQQNVPTSIPGLPGSLQQVGEVHVKGIELEGVARLNSVLSINAAYSYTDAIISKSRDPAELGTQLSLVPKHQASLLLDYTWRLSAETAMGFGGGVRYVGEAYGSAGELGLAPENTQVDALFRYTRGPWRFTLNVNNLFDKKYLGNCDGYGSCWYGYSRMVMGTLTREWGMVNR